MQHPLDPEFVPVETGLASVDVFDVRFSGWNGERIAAWLLLPRLRSEPLPLIVQYQGYGGGRGLPYQHLVPSSAGYAHLIVDNRGQGSDGYVGVTPDPDPDSVTGHFPGFMTRGITDPERYYHRRLITDAVRGIEAGAAHPAVDPSRIITSGRSMGGGIAIAAATLTPGVRGVFASVPFLSDFGRAVRLTDAFPYGEIARYLRIRRDDVATVFSTLAYFDVTNFASRATAPALIGVALMDEVCPPSTVYAAYNRYAGPKSISVWQFNGHEGGEAFEIPEQLAFFAATFEGATPRAHARTSEEGS